MNKLNKSKYLSLLYMVFSGTSAFIQIVSLPEQYIYATGILTVFFGVLSYIYMKRSNEYKKNIELFSNISNFIVDNDHLSRFKVRKLRNDAELAEIIRIDRLIYGEEASDDNLKKWYHIYPDGLLAIVTNRGEIVGGTGFWPIKKTPFKEIIEGKREEKDITSRSLYSYTHDFSCSNWYFSSIVLKKEYRNTEAASLLLREAIANWLASKHISFPINIVAFAYSKEGEKLLTKLGFHKIDNKFKKSSMPVYLLTLNNLYEVQEKINIILPRNMKWKLKR